MSFQAQASNIISISPAGSHINQTILHRSTPPTVPPNRLADSRKNRTNRIAVSQASKQSTLPPMASSSTHLTTLEVSLHASWRTSSIHLRSLDAHGWVADLTQLFAEVLDVGYKDLACRLWPPRKRQAEQLEWERQMRGMVEAEVVRVGEVQRIECAASAVGEAADALEGAGRVKEAATVRDVAEELHELAMQVANERAAQRTHGRDGSEEMETK